MITTNDYRVAKWADSLGYTIAGFAADLYEGAEFLRLPMFISGDEPTEEELRYCASGRVVEIVIDRQYPYDDGDETTWNRQISFVYVTEDGTQISTQYGETLELRFKDPERVNT